MIKIAIIKKIKNKYRLYSRKKDKKTNRRRNLGTFDSLPAAKKHERAIQFFKSHTDDGASDCYETKMLSRLSDIATYLEEAGFIDVADKAYMAMSAIDPNLDLEDDIVDGNDLQNNIGGGMGFSDMSPGHGGPSMGVDVAEKLASFADKLDEMGCTEEANTIDSVIDELIKARQENIAKQTKSKEKDTKEQSEQDLVAGSNGQVGSGMVDNQSAGMGQGLSDQYFYRGPGSIESNL